MSASEPHAGAAFDPSGQGPTSLAIDHVAGKWAVAVVVALSDGPMRFNALRRRVEGVSEKMLAQTVRALVRDGLVVRAPAPGRSQRVDYSLTELGGDFAPHVVAMAHWIRTHKDEMRAAQQRYDAEG